MLPGESGVVGYWVKRRGGGFDRSVFFIEEGLHRMVERIGHARVGKRCVHEPAMFLETICSCVYTDGNLLGSCC